MLRTKTKCWVFVVAAISVIALACPRSARADETSIAVDLDHVRAFDPLSTGAGLGVRLGPRLHVPLLVMGPEIGFGYDRFTGDHKLNLYRGTAGLRIGVGEIIRPGLFLHLGVGRLDGVENVQAAADETRTAFTWDAGLSLDLTFLPLVDVGAHVAWGSLAAPGPDPSFGWLILGLHAALIL